jgi:hypothetical protein
MLSIQLAQVAGYLASTLVFAAFYTRTMVPLRILAIGSNVAFLAYAIPLHLWAIVVLHGLLLPLNCQRLLQIRRLLKRITTLTKTPPDMAAMFANANILEVPAGSTVFRRGDAADCAYYIHSGTVHFPEIDAELGTGAVFGEMGLFSGDQTRTASARCETRCELYRIDHQALVIALYQNAALAIGLLRLVMARMVQNMQRLEQRLAELTPPQIGQRAGE